MHDLDRTQLELGQQESEPDQFDVGYSGEQAPNTGPVLDEVEEMEYATELLEVNSDRELDRFLGSVLNRVTRSAMAMRPDVFQALRRPLRDIARRLLPQLGRAVGARLAPGRGADIGAQLATRADSFLGLELEGLSAEDREFEVARHVVRLAAEAARQAAQTPPRVPAAAASRAALAEAARRHAPGLLGRTGEGTNQPSSETPAEQTGRWVRRGRTIILMDI